MNVFTILLAVSVRICSNSLANLFQKKLIAHFPSALAINAAAFSLLSVALLPRAWMLKMYTLPTVFWLWALADGILGTCGNALMVKALQKGELSVLGPINAWKPVIGMIGGVLLLSELPNVPGIVGLGLIVWGSYWILGADEDRFHWRILLRSDIQLRFYALLCTGVEAVILKRLVLLSTPETAFISWCWGGALFSLAGTLLMGKGRFPAIPHERSVYCWLGLLALCFGAMQYTTNLVFKLLPVGPSLALFQLSAAVNLWLGWRFFRERGMKQKILGTGLTILGAALILLCQ